jgi:2-oxoglutarate ferredoxin oxidoreductase subunit gamma
MRHNRIAVQFCGFGGQGLVLSAAVLGTGAVGAGMYAVQTQSYGSEARGGECQAELILSREPINSPAVTEVDVLVAMSQPALTKYLSRLRTGGVLVFDPMFVERPERDDVQMIEVPVTQIAADEIGQQITANMLMLGFLAEATALVSKEELARAIEEAVPSRFVSVNLRAADRGRALAAERAPSLEL